MAHVLAPCTNNTVSGDLLLCTSSSNHIQIQGRLGTAAEFAREILSKQSIIDKRFVIGML